MRASPASRHRVIRPPAAHGPGTRATSSHRALALVAAMVLLPMAAANGPRGQAAAPPRIVRGPYLQPAPAGSVRIVWYTDVRSDGLLEVAAEGGSWLATASSGSVATRHEAVVSGLEPDTSYVYRIAGSQAVLADASLRSLFELRTPPAGRLRILAFGDGGTGTPEQARLARVMFQETPLPDLVLMTGDTVLPRGAESDYDAKFFQPYAPLLSRVPFYASLGNHDYETENAGPYFRIFSLPANGPRELLPESAYSFEQAGVHVTVHDSNLSGSTLRSVVGPWHVLDVQSSSARFRLAAQHHPPYSSGPNSVIAPTPTIRSIFPALFSSSGVDLVLTGHEHFYERTRPMGGVVYVVSGAGGQALYPRVATNDFTEVIYAQPNPHSYTVIDVAGRVLALRQTDSEGCRVDSLTLEKPLAETDAWRVLKGLSAPPPDWFAPGFEDSSWPQAASAFGRGSPDLHTVFDDMPGLYLTVYARASFTLAPPVTADRVLLRVRYDDGLVAYLNGSEVVRRNLATGQGHRTPAAGAHAGDGFETFEISPALLRPGPNVLAVEGHNRSLDDRSFVLAPELTLLDGTPGRCP
jgi:hypothetical protein